MHKVSVTGAALAIWMAIAGPGHAAGKQTVPSLLDAIELWLVSNFELEPAEISPRIEFVSRETLLEIRYGSLAFADWVDVVAAYEDDEHIIYLRDDWTGRSATDISIIVHEMVHHLQSSAGTIFACPARREVLAYRAQDEWLRLFGLDLKSAVGIDETTLLVATVCTH